MMTFCRVQPDRGLKSQLLKPWSAASFGGLVQGFTWMVVIAVALILLLSIPAQAAISLATTGATASSTGSINRDLVVPTIVDGDLLVAHVAIRGNRTITPPSGWTLVDQVYVSNGRITQGVYYRVGLAADSSTTVRWNFNNSDDNAGVIRAYRGVDTVAPIGNFSGNINGGTASLTLTALSIATTVANEWIMTFYGAADGAANPVTIPVGMSERYDFDNGGGGNGLSLAGDDEARPTAGPTGDRVSTSSQSDRYVAQLIALKPIEFSTVASINLANANPTSAATVSWTVTFSKGVTGVSAAAFTLAPSSGVSGAYITAVTGSGTTWTVTANTGIGAGTLGLNQSGAGSVVPTLTGTFTGAVYTISATPALAQYRMDEASWNGTVGEVADSSGSYPGRAMNSANTTDVTGQEAKPGNPGTCRYGAFNSGYVQTPLPNLVTDFTITGWIRTTNNTTQVGQRILIDDEGTTPATGYGFSFNDAGAGVLRFYSRGITSNISFDSIYPIATNTWYFVAAVADIANKKRTIYVFNQSGVLLDATTEPAWTSGTWGTDGGPVTIGAETSASAESALHFVGNLDEVRVYGKVLNQAALTSMAAQTHPCAVSAPDHLVIQSSGSGLTCAASTLTVVACLDTACTPYTGGVSGTLSATGAGMTVNWDGSTGGAAGSGFVIPAGGSVSKNVQVATAGVVTFGLASATPTPINPTVCNFGTNSPANDNCVFTARTAGFIFSDTSTPGDPYTILPQRSGIATAANALYLRAVQASATNPAVCTPAIVSSTTSVNMGYTCNNPLTCQAASDLATINATPIAAGSPNANPTQFSTPVSLTFDANGSAPITARFDDVGRITLNANKTITPTGGTAVTMTGSSNAFVVAPDYFGFSAVTAGPIKAGTAFSATVTAYNKLGSATGNFGKETAAQGVTLTSTLVTPNPVTYPAASNPALGNNVIPGSEFGAGGMVTSDANGVATVNNIQWDEVGNISLTAALTNVAGYLSSGLSVSGTSASMGAFIPDHFDTAVVVTAGVPMPCPTALTCPTLYNGFVYSGQPFKLQITARNLANGTTTNYRNAYGLSHDVILEAWDALGSVTMQNPPGTGTLATATVLASAFGAVSPGVALTNAPAYTLPPATAPTDIYLRAVDTVSTTVTSRRATPANSVEAGVKVASGRIRIPNVYGSERLALPMAVTVQYYNGSYWLTSLTDSVTWFDSNLSTMSPTPGNLLANNANCAVVNVPGAASVSAGIRTLVLARVPVAAPAPKCLTRFSLNFPSYLPNAQGSATFGIYKSPLIYRRENY